MPLINTTEKLLFDWLFTAAAVTRPSSWTAVLYTTLPDNEGAGGVEVVGGGYAPQACALTVTAGDPTVATNSAAIEYPVATALWGTVVGVGIKDNLGRLLGWGALNVSRLIDVDDIFRIPSGELDVNMIAA